MHVEGLCELWEMIGFNNNTPLIHETELARVNTDDKWEPG